MAEMSMVSSDMLTRLARVRLKVPLGIPVALYTENSLPFASMACTVPLEEVKAVELTRTRPGARRSRRVAVPVSARTVAVVWPWSISRRSEATNRATTPLASTRALRCCRFDIVSKRALNAMLIWESLAAATSTGPLSTPLVHLFTGSDEETTRHPLQKLQYIVCGGQPPASFDRLRENLYPSADHLVIPAAPKQPVESTNLAQSKGGQLKARLRSVTSLARSRHIHSGGWPGYLDFDPAIRSGAPQLVRERTELENGPPAAS